MPSAKPSISFFHLSGTDSGQYGRGCENSGTSASSSREEASEMTQKRKWSLWSVLIDFSDISKEPFSCDASRTPLPERCREKPTKQWASDKSVDTARTNPYNKVNPSWRGTANINLLMDVETSGNHTDRFNGDETDRHHAIGAWNIIELEKLVDDPDEVMVNDTLVAKGRWSFTTEFRYSRITIRKQGRSNPVPWAEEVKKSLRQV